MSSLPSKRTAHIQFAQLGKPTTFDGLQNDHKALGLDVIARKVEVLQLRQRVEQHRIADEANALVLHLDAYGEPPSQRSRSSTRCLMDSTAFLRK